MKRLLLIAAAAAMISAPASANLIFNLSGATLQYGGQLTGSITLSDDLTQVVDLNISAPAADAGAFHFSAYTYTFANAIISTHLPNQYIRIDEPGGYELQFAFPVFTASGATFYTNGSSSDHTAAAGNRIITGGSFVAATNAAVPEPATWALTLAGLGLIGFGMSRRLRPARLGEI